MRKVPELRKRFEELVDRHYAGLSSYLRFLTGGSAEFRDIVHQAFLAAHDRLASGRPFEGDPGKWLRGAARNLVHAWWRDKRKLPEPLADRLRHLAERADDANAESAEAELSVALKHCLKKLSDDDRRLIGERYEKGIPVTEIAETTTRNVSTLYVRLHRIREGLRRCVKAVLSPGGGT